MMRKAIDRSAREPFRRASMVARVIPLLVAGAFLGSSALAQQNHIDTIAPLAPELASYGTYDIGVRTLQVTDRNRPDILNTKEGAPTARYDRTLTLEIWYPATPLHFGIDLSPSTQDTFSVVPNTPPLRQAAVRNAAIQPGRYPLVLYSHTSLGHRRQSSFLCTHLAGHGYVVAAVDHSGNTFTDLAARVSAGIVLNAQER